MRGRFVKPGGSGAAAGVRDKVSAVTDEPGVMGNLPRSRPGRRSEKRASEVKPPKPKATRAKAGAGGPKKASASGARKAGAGKAPAAKAGASKGGARAAASRSGPKATRARPGGPAATTPSAGLGDDRAPDTAVREERVETTHGSDPITAALRLGMSVGDAGLKVVSKLVQRLPRP